MAEVQLRIVDKPRPFLMEKPLSNTDARSRVSTRAQVKNLTRDLQGTPTQLAHDEIAARSPEGGALTFWEKPWGSRLEGNKTS